MNLIFPSQDGRAVASQNLKEVYDSLVVPLFANGYRSRGIAQWTQWLTRILFMRQNLAAEIQLILNKLHITFTNTSMAIARIAVLIM